MRLFCCTIIIRQQTSGELSLGGWCCYGYGCGLKRTYQPLDLRVGDTLLTCVVGGLLTLYVEVGDNLSGRRLVLTCVVGELLTVARW